MFGVRARCSVVLSVSQSWGSVWFDFQRYRYAWCCNTVVLSCIVLGAVEDPSVTSTGFQDSRVEAKPGHLTPRCCQFRVRSGAFQMIPMVLGLGRVEVENYQGSPLHCGCVFWGLVRHCYLAGCKTCRFVEESFEKAPATRRLGVASLLGTHHGYRGVVVRNGCEHRFGVVCGREGWVPQGFGLGVGLC